MSATVPAPIRDGLALAVVSISGGKDSTAVALYLRELGVPFRMVFADTGWEAAETYAHLDYLATVLGPIDRVGVEGGMVARMRHRAGFPSRLQRWCTRELKVEPVKAYHDQLSEETGLECVSVVGVRRDESRARATALEFEDDDKWGGYVWRPIVSWSAEDVVAIHRQHGVRMNPLYHRGHDRVGCYPCVFFTKADVRLVADHAPERIDEIRVLERELTATRATHNAEAPGRFAVERATFVQSKDGGPSDIDSIVEWARTTRGGRQLDLLPHEPDGGCFRWGMCEPPTKEEP